jgi:serine/threonine-protein kinase
MKPPIVPVQPGDLIASKFKVEQVLGAGGVGVVVAARHLQLDERVALKFLLPEAVRNEVDVARFCREAQAAVRLRSEHVARVIDVGTLENGSPYMVMEYLTGRDLGDVLDEHGPLPAEEAVDYVLQACEAIAEAHSVGFIHRDIKPSNLFLTERSDGSPLVKVLDFGIAKATSHAAIGEGLQELTRTKTMLGSPMYMSPEQVRNSKDLDQRSDIWSVGIVLYELLSGVVPFDADSVTGVVARVVGDPLPPLRERRPEVPAGLAEVVTRCLEKRPEDRYENVAELAFALAPFGPEHARVSVERIAGTLGVRDNRRRKSRLSTSGSRSSGNGELLAEKTIKSASTPVLIGARRRPALVLAGAALVGTSVALITWLYGRPADPRSSATATASAVLARDSSRAAGTLEAPTDVAPAFSAPSASAHGELAPPKPREPRVQARKPAGAASATTTPMPRPSPPERPDIGAAPQDAAASVGSSGVIDTTVDTRQ